MRAGSASFPGIETIRSAQMSFTHGISPSVAMLEIAPSQNFAALTGDLVFRYGRRTITFQDCRVDTSSFVRNSSGLVWQLAILDRRWKWTTRAGGCISGHWNRRHPNGTLIDASTRTPQELAVKLLEAMGEKNYDVKDLPNDARPEVRWDYDLPAEALAQLCDDLGCRVVLRLNNTVAIRRTGEGQKLPDRNTILDESIAYDLPEAPDEVAIVGGNTLYQADFLLGAVGLDTDGTVVPVDDLSYKPAAGWSVADFPYMMNVSGNDGKNRELAKRTVYRWYRIRDPLIQVPGYKAPVGGHDVVTFRDQILPIEKEQVATEIRDNTPVRLAARVSGVFFRELNAEFTNSQSTTDATPVDEANNKAIVDRGFTIDTARGIVQFAKPIYRNTTPTAAEVTIGEAKLRLRTACSVRHEVDFAWDRWEHRRKAAKQKRGKAEKLDTPTKYVQKPELVLTHEPVYDANYNVKKVVDNKADIEPIADLYLDGIERTYQVKRPKSRTYAGLTRVDLDGAIQQAVFRVSRQGTTTQLARNNEINDEFVATIPYKQRREMETNRVVNTIIRNTSTFLHKMFGRPMDEL